MPDLTLVVDGAERTVAPMEMVRLDDDLVLWLTKPL